MGSPATARPLQDRLHQPTPAKVSTCGLKMGAPRIRLQERRRTCDTEHGGAFALQRAFFGALLRRAAPENRPWMTKNTKIRLTVREDLFGRESVQLWMHGCMASMGIKQHPFRARPYTSPHFCGGSAHIGLLKESRTRTSGHRGRGGGSRPGCDASGQSCLNFFRDERGCQSIC